MRMITVLLRADVDLLVNLSLIYSYTFSINWSETKKEKNGIPNQNILHYTERKKNTKSPNIWHSPINFTHIDPYWQFVRQNSNR